MENRAWSMDHKEASAALNSKADLFEKHFRNKDLKETRESAMQTPYRKSNPRRSNSQCKGPKKQPVELE